MVDSCPGKKEKSPLQICLCVVFYLKANAMKYEMFPHLLWLPYVQVQSPSGGWLFVTPRLYQHQAPLPRNFLGKNTGVGCRLLLQGICPTQGSSPHLLHWQVGSLPLSHLEACCGSQETTNSAISSSSHLISGFGWWLVWCFSRFIPDFIFLHCVMLKKYKVCLGSREETRL